MASLPFTYLTSGNITEALSYTLTDYFPYALFWIFLGLGIFAVVHTKTQSFGISGFILALYFVVVGSLLPFEYQPFIYLFIAVLGVTLFIRVWFK